VAKILVADDEKGILDLMERVLGRRGHEVETFGDGASAVEALESGDYDLVVTDLRMPQKTGLDVLAMAKARRRSMPVILVSGSTEPEDRARAEALGVYMVLHKPVDLAYLTTIIDSALEEEFATRGTGTREGTGTQTATGSTPGAGSSSSGKKGGKLVKVFDREACLANLVAYCLRKQGFRATTDTLATGADVIIAGEPAFVEAARRESPRAEIIVLYATGERDEAVRALDAGADIAIARPFDPELLFAHIRAAARREHCAPAPAPAKPAESTGPISRNRIAAVKLE
jgi:DNA-binding response OmpR family regulator